MTRQRPVYHVSSDDPGLPGIDTARRHVVMRSLIATTRFCWNALCVLIAVGLLVSAYGGCVDPALWVLPAMMAMTFPFWVGATVVAAIVNLMTRKRRALLQWVTMILSVGALNDYCPLNVFNPSPDPSERQLKFMTYNTFGFCDSEDCYPYGTNRTASTIIGSGADIICVQELGYLMDLPYRSLGDEQIDSINDIYPYYAFEENKQVAILSKFPIREIDLRQPDSDFAGFQGAVVDIDGTELLVVSIHLQSIGLNDEDKLIYHRMTDGDSGVDWGTAGHQLYSKLANAFVQRAEQAKLLREQLDSIGIPNIITAGDFNDISGCYAMREIRAGKMKNAYTEAGLGPVVTYHKDRFLFNIDHILYQGAVRVNSIHRGNIKSSDHYPVYATFTIGED